MPTETDVYKIDTGDAESSLSRLAKAAEEMGHASEHAGENVSKSMVVAELAVEALKKAFEFAKEAITDTVKEAAEAEKTWSQLKRVAGENTEKFHEMAGAMRDQLGVNEAMIGKMTQMLLQHGALPGQIDKTIRATLDFAAATGRDANDAMQTLIRGVEGGGQRLHMLSIRYKSTGEFTSDLTKLTEALNGQFSGAMAANVDTFAGRMEKLGGQVDALKESIGTFFINLEEKYHVLGALTEALKAARRAAGEKLPEDIEHERGLDKMDAEKKLGELEARRLSVEEKLAAWERGEGSVLTSHKDLLSTWNQITTEEKALTDKLDALNKEGGAPTGDGRKHSVGNADKSADKAQEEFAKSLQKQQVDQDAWQKAFNDKNEKFEYDQKVRAHTREQEAAFKHQEAITKVEIEAADKRFKKQQEMEQRKIAIEEATQNQFMAWEQKGAQFAIDEIGNMLMANTQYNKKMEEGALRRGEITNYEGQVLKNQVDAQKQLQKEAEAATQKRTADVLMGIAKEAGVKAIFEGAEALGALARGDTPSATAHGASALEFAAVAIAAGGGAALINSNRGMTAEEKNQVNAPDKAAADRAAKAAAGNSTATGGSTIGVTQNVYWMGIGAQSDIQQAAILEELRRKRDALMTGA